MEERRDLIENYLEKFRGQLRYTLGRVININKTLIYLLDKVGISSGNSLNFLADIPSLSEFPLDGETTLSDAEVLSMLRKLENEMSSISSSVNSGRVTINSFKEASEVTDVNVYNISGTEIAPDSERTSQYILDLLSDLPTLDFDILEKNFNIDEDDEDDDED